MRDRASEILAAAFCAFTLSAIPLKAAVAVPDTLPPVPSASALLKNGKQEIGVGFDEAVKIATASVLANYSLSGGTLESIRVVNRPATGFAASGTAAGPSAAGEHAASASPLAVARIRRFMTATPRSRGQSQRGLRPGQALGSYVSRRWIRCSADRDPG